MPTTNRRARRISGFPRSAGGVVRPCRPMVRVANKDIHVLYQVYTHAHIYTHLNIIHTHIFVLFFDNTHTQRNTHICVCLCLV